MTVLVHDYLLVYRGAERTFRALCDLYPGAPIRTLLVDAGVAHQHFPGRRIGTSRLNRIGIGQRNFKSLLPAFQHAAERLDVSGHDLVISSSSAFAHGIVPEPDAVHVCYCHTPFRYAWYASDSGLQQLPKVIRPAAAWSLNRAKRWDYESAQRHTRYIANSRITQQRIERFWGRSAPIVHPPVDVARFAAGEVQDYLLVVGEVVRHKQVELALEAAEATNTPIVIVGGGADENRLRSRYGMRDGVTFAGRIDDASLVSLHAGAKAFIVPNIEEFGIAAVEAQAAGRPVIAARGGGVLETVIEGETGLFYDPGDLRSLVRALRDRRIVRMDPAIAIANAARFSVEAFKSRMRVEISAAQSVKLRG